jgi:hypothetical protein
MPTHFEDQKFRDALIPNSLLDDAIKWIANNLSPEEVFKKEQLATWAEENGYEIPEE